MIVIITTGPTDLPGIYIGKPKGGDLLYDDLSMADQQVIDDFLSILDGDTGVAQITNVPGGGLSDISFGIPGASSQMQTKTFDYESLTTTQKNYVDALLTLLSE